MKKALVVLVAGFAVLSLASCKLGWYVNSDGSLTHSPKLDFPITISYTSPGIMGTSDATLSGVSLFYTLDGSSPGAASASVMLTDAPSSDSSVRFSLPMPAYPASVNFKGYFAKEGWQSSDFVSETLSLVKTKCAAPLADGYYTSYAGLNVSVYLVNADGAATLRYTTDGTDPKDTSPLWPGTADHRYVIPGGYSTMVVKARGFKDNYLPSDVVTATIAQY